jgi:hypothetical protein
MDWGYTIWRVVFAIAAVWNLIFALPGVVAPRAGFRMFYGVGTREFHPRFLHWLISVVILAFAAGHAIIAWDPAANLGLLAVAIFIKVLFASGMLVIHVQEKSTNTSAVFALGDVVFIVLFVMYLIGGARSL